MTKEEIEEIKKKQYGYYEKIELKESVPTQYIGSYILKWKNDICTKPEYGFNETDDVAKLLAYIEELQKEQIAIHPRMAGKKTIVENVQLKAKIARLEKALREIASLEPKNVSGEFIGGGTYESKCETCIAAIETAKQALDNES